MVKKESIKITKLEGNVGQIPDVPANPRFINKDRFEALCRSIEQAPEMLELREAIVYPHKKKFVVICGNMRLKACRKLGFETMPCKILPPETTAAKIREYAAKDNNPFGDNDWDILANEWDMDELQDWGMVLPTDWGAGEDLEDEEAEQQDEEETDDGEDLIDDTFTKQMMGDVLFESNNIFDIPNLLLEMQAGKLELPLSPWGANSRLRKDVTTYHFYVDDYRFEHLFKDPTNLLTSGCKAIVEPNCSLHDQTPIAFGLSQIYKKRWLARYMQECGVKVYVDLNVSHKFIEYNKMGVPKGYNAFMTRGLIGWMDSLKSDLQVAQEISGLEKPNLIVYGGGEEIKAFCMENGLLYLTDFINAKKLD